MYKPSVTITGVEEVLADIDQRIASMHAGILADLDAVGKQAAQEMIDTHTFQNRTFRLENSIGYTVVQGVTAAYTLGIFASAPYASQVEFGHPGPPPARPYPFFWPVWYRFFPDVLEMRLETTVEETLGGVRGAA